MNKYDKPTVIQRDYVRHVQPSTLRRPKSILRKKQSSFNSVLPSMAIISATMLVTFIYGLHFTTHHNKKEKPEILQVNKVTVNNLPPKPKERWRYIKELEKLPTKRVG